MKPVDYESLQAEIKRQLYASCKGRQISWSALKDALQRAWQRGYIHSDKPVKSLNANTKVGREALLTLGQQFRRSKMITKTTLGDRGWTARLLKKYRLTPDLQRKNPHYSRGAPMLLYQLNRVAHVEHNSAVAADLAKVLARRSLRQQATLKRAELESFHNFLDSVEFLIPRWPVPELVDREIAHYNDYHRRDSYFQKATPIVLADMIVSFFLYSCTEFETWARLYCGEEYEMAIYEKVAAAVHRTYPNLVEQIAGLIYE